MLGLVFLVLALLLAIAAALNLPPHPRIHWGWAAFACYIAYLLFGRIPLL
jgi:hypothetical protein